MQENKFQEYSIETSDTDSKLKAVNKWYLIRIIILIILNTVLFELIVKGFTNKLQSVLIANLIGFNILGFILGSVVALFPYKSLSYNKKYLRASLLSIFILQFIMMVGLLLLSIMSLISWY